MKELTKTLASISAAIAMTGFSAVSASASTTDNSSASWEMNKIQENKTNNTDNGLLVASSSATTPKKTGNVAADHEMDMMINGEGQGLLSPNSTSTDKNKVLVVYAKDSNSKKSESNKKDDQSEKLPHVAKTEQGFFYYRAKQPFGLQNLNGMSTMMLYNPDGKTHLSLTKVTMNDGTVLYEYKDGQYINAKDVELLPLLRDNKN